MTNLPDTDKRYRVDEYPGVAFWIKGWPQMWSPNLILFTDEETGESYYLDSEMEGDGEWTDEEGEFVIAVMVGDDREHLVEIADLDPIDDNDYCGTCGQIGCGHG